MPSQDLQVSNADDDFALAEIFDESGRPSTDIYRNLFSDPIFAHLADRKKLSYRELLLVVTTVVGALDKELVLLRRSSARYERVNSIINAPLISPQSVKKTEGQDDEPGEEGKDKAGKEESHWFLRYLTLRNVLGALVVAISLAGGFFAWLNQDYRSILDARKERVKDLEGQIERFTKQISEKDQEFFKSVDKLRSAETARDQLGGRLQGAEDQVKSLQASIRSLQQASGAQASAVQSVEELKAELERVRTEKGASDQASAEWRSRYNELNARIREKESLVTQKELELSKADSRLRNSVDAWNQLLTYLYSHSTTYKTEVQRSYLDAQLKTLADYTRDVPNMKQALR
jgi:flagellar motility protein MotE (MotC chaperone)